MRLKIAQSGTRLSLIRQVSTDGGYPLYGESLKILVASRSALGIMPLVKSARLGC